MSEKLNINEHVNKRDLEIILEVNKKAIEIQTEVAEQNEEIINFLSELKAVSENLDAKADKIIDKSEEISRGIFKIQVLFMTGVISLVVQLAQIFLHK